MTYPATLINVIKLRNAIWEKRGLRLGTFAETFARRRAT